MPRAVSAVDAHAPSATVELDHDAPVVALEDPHHDLATIVGGQRAVVGRRRERPPTSTDLVKFRRPERRNFRDARSDAGGRRTRSRGARRCARRSRSGAGPGSERSASPRARNASTRASARLTASAANTAARSSASRSSPVWSAGDENVGVIVEVRRRGVAGEEVGLAQDGDQGVDGWSARRRRRAARGPRARRPAASTAVVTVARSPWRAASRSRTPTTDPARDARVHRTRARSRLEARDLAGRRAASPPPGPRRRAAPRWRGRERPIAVLATRQRLARRRCAAGRSTRSIPVTTSVTGCSTCRRVLTSRKKIVPSSSTRNSTVPAVS